MKLNKRTSWVFLLSVAASSSVAVAHTPEKHIRVQTAVAAAHEHFKDNETGATVKTYVGIKAWLETSGLKSKIYLTGDRELNYTCKEIISDSHSESDYRVECEKN